jgi:hypothetical protein
MPTDVTASLAATILALSAILPGARVAIAGGDLQAAAYSSNWAGYAIAGGPYRSVTARWTVPRVFPTTQAGASALWVGLDGVLDRHLIQTGTEQDERNGRAEYFAWWEILPAPAVRITAFSVRPGDRMSATISRVAPERWRITIVDARSGRFSTTRAYAGPAASVEWIEEAPVEGRSVMPLARLGTATFDLLTVNGSTVRLEPASRIVLAQRSVVATPSLPDADTDGFTVERGSLVPPARSS